jgi:hypothetical protein
MIMKLGAQRSKKWRGKIFSGAQSLFQGFRQHTHSISFIYRICSALMNEWMEAKRNTAVIPWDWLRAVFAFRAIL